MIVNIESDDSSAAVEFTDDGIKYRVTDDDESKEVSLIDVESKTGGFSIPETVTYNGTEYTVTSIGDWAFSGCSGLTEVTIGNHVTTIGERAFHNCSKLTSITIPDSVTSIGDSAFSGCSGLTEVTIGNHVTTIGDWAFSGCSGLTEVTIGNSVTSIGDGAFSDCSGLTSITIPDSVTSIGDWAFYGCSGLTSVTIPDSVTSIGDYAFLGCSGLTSVTIGNSVTTIGDDVFSGCSGLTSVTIPDSVTSIGDDAFSGCSGLTSVTIPDSVTSIGDGAFLGCSDLEEIEVDTNNQKYSSIDGVLFNKDKTTLIQYPAGNARTGYTIPDSVTSIGDYAFYPCSGLTSVTIPDSVTSIGDLPFLGCSGLEKIEVDTDNQKYSSIDGVLFNNDKTTLIQYPAGNARTGYTIPDSVTSIGFGAFGLCSGLTSVTIGNSVTSIGDSAFGGCSKLTSITIPDSVTSIGDDAFSGCSGLTSVTIPDSVITIGDWAFSDCSGLTSVTILNSEVSIGDRAFVLGEDAENIVNLTVYSYEPDKIKDKMKYAIKEFITVEYKMIYAVKFVAENGTDVIESRELGEGTTIVKPADPTKESDVQCTYTFSGWDGYTDGMTVSGDHTFKATFTSEPRSYTIRFVNENGDVLDSRELDYGAIIAKPTDEPTKESDVQCTYTFSGWDGYTDGMTVSGDHTFKAAFTSDPRSYTIEFVDENGDVLDSKELDYGAEIVKPESDPAKVSDDDYDYMFIGWDGFAAGMTVTGEATFEAMYKAVLRNLPEVKEGNTEFVVDGTAVSLPGSMVEDLKAQTTGSAMFDFQENGIDLDKATLDALSGDVDLSIGKVADADLPADVKKAVGDRPVYSISLRADDADVHDLGGKATVTLYYVLKEGEEADNLVIWYVNDDGEYTRMPCTYSNGFVVFETTHFSYYAVMYESPSGSPGDDDNTMIIAAVAVIALIAVLGLFLFFRSRKAGSA